MRLSLLLPCVIVGGLVGVSVWGQVEKAPAELGFSSGAEAAASDSYIPETVDESFASPASENVASPESGAHETASEELPAEVPLEQQVLQEEQELRRQYLQLIEQKAGLMDRSALREAISRSERDIEELRADAKLHEARQLLLDLVRSHPETKAATAARRMLQDQEPGLDGGPSFEPRHAPYGGAVPTPLAEPDSAPVNAPFYNNTSPTPDRTYDPDRRKEAPIRKKGASGFIPSGATVDPFAPTSPSNS